MLWLILGIVIGAGVVYLVSRPSLKLAWYDWVLLALAVVFALLAIQNYFASMAELEPRAAGLLLAGFGIPALVFGGAFCFRLWFVTRDKEDKTAQNAAPSAATN